MAGKYTVYVGTVGQGLWRSPDAGQKWMRVGWMPDDQVFHLEAQVRAVAVDPRNSQIVFAGDELGLYRSEDGGTKWKKVPGKLDGVSVWSLAIDPVNNDTMFAGVRPSGLYRSRDAGKTWEKLKAPIEEYSMIGPNRILNVRIDPLDHRKVWAGSEHGGVYRSFDGGDSWVRVRGGLTDHNNHADVHDVTIIPGVHLEKNNGSVRMVPGRGETLLVTGPGEMMASDDLGESWNHFVGAKDFPTPYMHTVAVKRDDPKTVYVGISDQAIGSTGGIMRTRDGGKSWQSCPLPQEPNSGFFTMAQHPSDPNVLWAGTLLGELYYTEDGGDTWHKTERELTEIRALKVVPN